jgi:hypothetical protein
MRGYREGEDDNDYDDDVILFRHLANSSVDADVPEKYRLYLQPRKWRRSSYTSAPADKSTRCQIITSSYHHPSGLSDLYNAVRRT